MTGGRLQARARLRRGRDVFCFTYGDGVADVDIARRDRLPPRARQAGDGHRGAAARPLRRARARRRRASTASSRSRAATAAGSTAASSSCRRACIDLHRRRRHAAGKREPLERPRARRRADGLRARRLLAADGHAARQDHARGAVGSRASAPWKVWSDVRAGRSPTFWRGKRVLVTGHTGFKGAWLALWLQPPGRRGHRHRAAATDGANLLYASAATRATMCDSRIVDIRDAAGCRALRCARRGPRSCSTSRRSRWCARAIASRSTTFATNVMGTAHVLDALRGSTERARRRRSSPPTRSTRTASGAARTARTTRSAATTPTAPARPRASSSSRATASSFLAGAAASRVATARAGNVIGGGDWARGPADPRRGARLAGGQAAARSAGPTRCGRGSTCSSRCRLSAAGAAVVGAAALAGAYNFGPELAKQ